MMDDADFLDKIKKGIYQLAVVHSKPEDSCYHYVKFGHESLYISLKDGNSFTFYPECRADYYLVCLASEKNRYEPLFKHIRKDTIK